MYIYLGFTVLLKFTVLFVFKGKIVTNSLLIPPLFFHRSVWVSDKLFCYHINVSFLGFNATILEAVLAFCGLQSSSYGN